MTLNNAITLGINNVVTKIKELINECNETMLKKESTECIKLLNSHLGLYSRMRNII